ncbi:hypothetical protein [Citrobacter sp. Marseille-Q6884]|uniref:hypothetical protein n=1 Tax=Citrobacter sp. Marseille-Q6884 TaxID=2956786 RepID=UPI0021B27D5E|nr:hypothetical protein [Citrobacter sp. Marseille-Q6884]
MALVSCGNAGLAQRVIRLLKEKPLLNSEIANLLNIDEGKLFKDSKTFLRRACSYDIEAGPIFITDRGAKDRLYTLKRYEPKKALATSKLKNHISFSLNKKPNGSDRRLYLAAAKERRGLINSNNYSEEAERALCEKYHLF